MTGAGSISVIVATFGEDVWIGRAQRAIESANNQTVPPHEIIHVHGDTLAAARNQGAERAEGQWLLFLDADDELDKHYIEAMTFETTAASLRSDAPYHLFQPATLGVVNGVEDQYPVMIPQRDISTGNYLVIGTVVLREQFLRVGGFEEWPLYEDWDLWIRCMKEGAVSHPVPGAIYRVHVNPNSRNTPDRATQVRVYNEIRRKHYR